MKKIISFCAMLCVIGFSILGFTGDVRLKDIASIAGVRENQLYGYGLVVGLNGSGDRQSEFPTLQSVANMLRRLGVNISSNEVSNKVKTRNVAAVLVTATLPAAVKPGTRIDVTISSIGDAVSLENGVLIQTPLQAADGKIYAVSQGPISLGMGVASSQRSGAPMTVARIPAGAIVENEVPSTVLQNGRIVILLKQPDFTTAARITENVNKIFENSIAIAQDSGTIDINMPQSFKDNPISFISQLENVRVTPDTQAKLVINERTGTIVAGKDVKISTVAITHGNISVSVTATRAAGNKAAGKSKNGETEDNFNKTETFDGQGMLNIALVDETVSVQDLVKALNTLSVAPKDLIAILQAIYQAGALYAQIEII